MWNFITYLQMLNQSKRKHWSFSVIRTNKYTSHSELLTAQNWNRLNVGLRCTLLMISRCKAHGTRNDHLLWTGAHRAKVEWVDRRRGHVNRKQNQGSHWANGSCRNSAVPNCGHKLRQHSTRPRQTLIMAHECQLMQIEWAKLGPTDRFETWSSQHRPLKRANELGNDK